MQLKKTPWAHDQGKGLQGCELKGSLGVKESEGMNPHTPKRAFILGIRVPVDSQIFIE